VEAKDEKNSSTEEEKLPTFDVQINRVRQTVDKWGESVRAYRAPFVDDEGRRAFVRKIGLGPRRGGRASIVPSDECEVELGAPPKANVNLVLWTHDSSLIKDGEIGLMGPDMKAKKKVSWPYAQVIMVALEESFETDPFTLESTQYLSNRLPGFMVRTVPGRLWARVSRKAVKDGMDFARLGAALIAAYKDDFTGVKAVEVLFVTEDDEHVRELETMAAESRIIMGKSKKLVLVGDGTYECADLDCETCDEKETCDAVRDILILRRKQNERRENL